MGKRYTEKNICDFSGCDKHKWRHSVLNLFTKLVYVDILSSYMSKTFTVFGTLSKSRFYEDQILEIDFYIKLKFAEKIVVNDWSLIVVSSGWAVNVSEVTVRLESVSYHLFFNLANKNAKQTQLPASPVWERVS